MPWMLMMSSTQFLIQDCEFVSSKAIEFLEKRASSEELDQYEIQERIHRYFQPIQVPIPHQILNLVNLSVIYSIATEKNKINYRIIDFPQISKIVFLNVLLSSVPKYIYYLGYLKVGQRNVEIFIHGCEPNQTHISYNKAAQISL